jgi:DNA-binding CsgD family transcriptional regulator
VSASPRAEKSRVTKLSPEQVERRPSTALELRLRPPGLSKEKRWKRAHTALLGKIPDLSGGPHGSLAAIPAELVEQLRAGRVTASEIARKCDLSPATVSRLLRKLGVPKDARGRRPDRSRRQVARLRAKGLSLSAVARILGISAQAVQQLLKHDLNCD